MGSISMVNYIAFLCTFIVGGFFVTLEDDKTDV